MILGPVTKLIFAATASLFLIIMIVVAGALGKNWGRWKKIKRDILDPSLYKSEEDEKIKEEKEAREMEVLVEKVRKEIKIRTKDKNR